MASCLRRRQNSPPAAASPAARASPAKDAVPPAAASKPASVTAVGALHRRADRPVQRRRAAQADVLQPVPVGLAGLDGQVLVGVGVALRAAGSLRGT